MFTPSTPQFNITFSSRLPVRGQMCMCATCGHGGHQECYRGLHERQPAVELPAPPPPQTAMRSRGRARSRTNSLIESEDDASTLGSGDSRPEVNFPTAIARFSRAHGHLCPAGCGHVCWAASDGANGGL